MTAVFLRRTAPSLGAPVWQPIQRQTRRAFSTTELSNGIKIAYDFYEADAKKSKKGGPIVFIHGFFGSKRNNRSMSKVLVRDLNRPVYAIDTRNHGDSSHSPVHNYTALAEDIELFIAEHKLESVTLIGHSMGAKIAMAVALRQGQRESKIPPKTIANLIPVDNAPVDAALHGGFGKYMQGMRRIEESAVTSLDAADKILQDYEESLPVRQFLLTNLIRDTEDAENKNKRKWQVPLKYLQPALNGMGDFPFSDPDSVRWEGPALFVRGTKSPYVADEMLPTIGRFFPGFRVVDVEAGHWVISEKPEEFREAVVDFLQDKA